MCIYTYSPWQSITSHYAFSLKAAITCFRWRFRTSQARDRKYHWKIFALRRHEHITAWRSLRNFALQREYWYSLISNMIGAPVTGKKWRKPISANLWPIIPPSSAPPPMGPAGLRIASCGEPTRMRANAAKSNSLLFTSVDLFCVRCIPCGKLSQLAVQNDGQFNQKQTKTR